MSSEAMIFTFIMAMFVGIPIVAILAAGIISAQEATLAKACIDNGRSWVLVDHERNVHECR